MRVLMLVLCYVFGHDPIWNPYQNRVECLRCDKPLEK